MMAPLLELEIIPQRRVELDSLDAHFFLNFGFRRTHRSDETLKRLHRSFLHWQRIAMQLHARARQALLNDTH
jgi:hypothetical protein